MVSLFFSAFMFYRVYFISGPAYKSILWNGIGFLWLIFLVSLIRVWSGAQELRNIQQIQERFIAEQRFFLNCRLTMKTMRQTTKTIASFVQRRKSTIIMPKKRVMLQAKPEKKETEFEIECVDDMKKNEQAKNKDDTEIEKDSFEQGTRNERSDSYGKAAKYVLEEANLDFIDNVKNIISQKDIIPKFYDGDLSTLLMRTFIIVFLTAGWGGVVFICQLEITVPMCCCEQGCFFEKLMTQMKTVFFLCDVLNCIVCLFVVVFFNSFINIEKNFLIL
ncbi:hypothetical protein RFI_20654 [Reticulomyxa filosa]|uniref:Uncharacterized protein n=1 Tax=Reticulomyxa filosa TaxID=46433 RepID=X6MU86_RETFI|nr:hypothetical protein RFI_20654 [Reticulomyxa filosa]|eukprot:ETO16685.1 hypothetical protein RFI_20654 [Reticulomyxa filosa]